MANNSLLVGDLECAISMRFNHQILQIHWHNVELDVLVLLIFHQQVVGSYDRSLIVEFVHFSKICCQVIR